MPNEFQIASSFMAVGAGQKSGVYSTFDASSGQLLWAKQVGTSSILWGSATDGTRIYVAIGDEDAANGGSWAALDVTSGNLLWQVPDLHGSADLAPMAVSNGVVYAASMAGGAGQSNMVALSAATGKILWKYPAGGSVVAGAAISGGMVFWGSGYTHIGPPYIGNNKFYAFSIDGK
jgi:polyvinyl alcohol dehydrogenase (cytochrome)